MATDRQIIDALIRNLFFMLITADDEALTDKDCNLMADISHHPAVQERLHGKSLHGLRSVVTSMKASGREAV